MKKEEENKRKKKRRRRQYVKYMVTHIVGRSFKERLIIFGISIYSVMYSARMKQAKIVL